MESDLALNSWLDYVARQYHKATNNSPAKMVVSSRHRAALEVFGTDHVMAGNFSMPALRIGKVFEERMVRHTLAVSIVSRHILNFVPWTMSGEKLCRAAERRGCKQDPVS